MLLICLKKFRSVVRFLVEFCGSLYFGGVDDVVSVGDLS
jgi:hypothetical protein